jgi:hypothetical protein
VGGLEPLILHHDKFPGADGILPEQVTHGFKNLLISMGIALGLSASATTF